MKKFLKYIFLTLVSSFMLLLSLQFFADNGLKKSVNSAYNDWLDILEGNVNADILIMGSSRAYFGYNPNIIETKLKQSTFNLGYSAAGYKLQLEKLKIYLSRNKKPKFIIQNIDLAFFNEDKLMPNENEFIPFLNDSLIFDLMLDYNRDCLFFNKIPLLKYNNRLSLFTEGIYSNFDSYAISKNNYTIKGFHPVDLTFVKDQDNLIRLKKIKSKELDFEEKIDVLLNFYRNELSDDTKVIFVWAPEHVERLSEEFQVEKKKIFVYLAEKIKNDNSIMFLNMSNDELSYDELNFFDTFHFNRTGANKFSSKLSELLLKIIE